MFLEHGADVNVVDEERWRPLHHAAYAGAHRVLQLLLRAPGVDVNAASAKRWRPIDVCTTGEAVRMLVDAGAVHAAELPGRSLSPLHHAAYHARLDTLEALLARGADAAAVFSPEAAAGSFNIVFGGTALHLAAAFLGFARGMKDELGSNLPVVQPALVSAQEAAVRRAAVCTALVRAGADVEALTTPPANEPMRDFKLSPLVVAAQYGDAAVIKALLDAGAAPNAVEKGTGRAALHFAADMGYTDAIYALVAGGADVNQRNAKVSTIAPLLIAVQRNRHRAVRALLELGADSSRVAHTLSIPPALLLPFVVDETTRALVARHRSGGAAPARACSLPECEARRRADYDDKRLMACPCKARAAAALLFGAALRALTCRAAAQLAFYCCREHQLQDRKRHKAACKAALDKHAS